MFKHLISYLAVVSLSISMFNILPGYRDDTAAVPETENIYTEVSAGDNAADTGTVVESKAEDKADSVSSNAGAGEPEAEAVIDTDQKNTSGNDETPDNNGSGSGMGSDVLENAQNTEMKNAGLYAEKEADADVTKEDSAELYVEKDTEDQEKPSAEDQGISESEQEKTDPADTQLKSNADINNTETETENNSDDEEESGIITDGTAVSGDSASWGAAAMRLDAAKARAEEYILAGSLNPDVTVAVIDSGINTAHSAFAGRISAASRSFVSENTSDYGDINGHGTHVAGIIAQNTPECVDLMILQVLDENLKGYAENVAAAIYYAVSNGADIINLSLGISSLSEGYSECAALIGDAVNNAYSNGCVVVASAGNGGTDLSEAGTCPAVLEHAVCVSAVCHDMTKYIYSNYGSSVDFCAPGDEIYGPYIGGTDTYQYLSGTSMGAPFVSAAYTYIKMYNGSKTADELTEILKSMCLDPGDTGFDTQYGYGLPVLSDIIPYTEGTRPAFYLYRGEKAGIYLNWSKKTTPGAVYDIYRSDAGAGDFTCIASLTDTKYYDADAVFGNTYDYYIKARANYLFTGSCQSETITQEAEISVTGFKIGVKFQSIGTGASVKLKGSVLPANATHKEIVWSSEDESIVSVDEDGVITGISPGTAKIILSTPDGKKTTYYKITVNEPDKCGNNITWSVTDDNILIISGTGSMYDYTFGSSVPWSDIKDQITKIEISSGITYIGNYAFSGFENVSEVSGMDDVTSIGRFAFSLTANLEEFDFPEKLETIGAAAFDSSGLKSVSLPASLNSIDVSELSSFGSLLQNEAFYVDDENPYFCSEDGVLFNKDKTVLISCPEKKQGVYEIPDTVSEISKSAFSDCALLTSVIIPEKVQEIPYRAFWRCSGLNEAELSSTVKVIAIEAFRYCTCLSEIDFKEGLEEIGDFAFQNTGLIKAYLPGTLNTLGRYAFSGTPIRELVINDGLNTIGAMAFYQCTGLESVTLPGSLNTLNEQNGSMPFDGCGNLEDVYLTCFSKYYLEIQNLEKDKCLYGANCHVIASGELDGGICWRTEGLSGDVTLIISGEGNMPDFPGVSETPWYDGASEITHIVIEKGITGIGSYSFTGFEKLEDITLPEGVEYFGENALRMCGSLEKYIYIPDDPSEVFFIEQEFQTYEYNGEEAPEPRVYIEKDGEKLSNGTDYKLSYRNNKGYGSGLTVIEFTGEYEKNGKLCLPFSIVEKLVDGENIKTITSIELSKTEYIYNGSECTPSEVVKSGHWTLKKNVDYILEYDSGRTDVGVYIVTAKGIGIYAGSGASASFTVLPGDISEMTAVLSEESYEYDGNAKTPSVTIGRLTEGRDYSLIYENNTVAGTASVKVTGTGNYTGTVIKTFSITEEKTEDKKDNDNQSVDSTLQDEKDIASGTDKEEVSLPGSGTVSDDSGIETAGGTDNTGSEKPVVNRQNMNDEQAGSNASGRESSSGRTDVVSRNSSDTALSGSAGNVPADPEGSYFDRDDESAAEDNGKALADAADKTEKNVAADDEGGIIPVEKDDTGVSINEAAKETAAGTDRNALKETRNTEETMNAYIWFALAAAAAFVIILFIAKRRRDQKK